MDYREKDKDLEDVEGIVLAGPTFEVYVFGYKNDQYLGDEFIGERYDEASATLMAQLVEKDPRKYSITACSAKVDTIEIVVEKVYDIEDGEGNITPTNVNTVYSKTLEVV